MGDISRIGSINDMVRLVEEHNVTPQAQQAQIELKALKEDGDGSASRYEEE